MQYNDSDLLCAYENNRLEKPNAISQPLLEGAPVSGYPLHPLYANQFLEEALNTSLLHLITYVHVVGSKSISGVFQPIVSTEWIDALFQVANAIWSQACLKLFYLSGQPITEFRDLAVLGFAGACLKPDDQKMVDQYNAKSPTDASVINVYLIEDSNGFACGTPVTKQVFLPVAGRAPEFLGNVLAHEIGHILLNPTGVDDSPNPNHIMFHRFQHLETPPGTRDGLFLSDCLGARQIARTEIAVFGGPPCTLKPRLGNNLMVVATKIA